MNAVLLAIEKDNRVPATVVGIALVLFGGWLISCHWRSWQKTKRDEALSPEDYRHYARQFRRRMQASGLVLLIGILVPVGDWGIQWKRGDAVLATVYWLAVLGLTCWVLVLALGDMLSTHSHSRIAMSRIRRSQQELEREVERLRSAAERHRRDR